MLVVAGPASVPRAIRDSLEALSSQVALALDSALTTEILLIRQSEARFSSLVQNSSDVVMVVEADSKIRYISPSVERVLGHAAGELEGTKLTVLIQPEDRAGVLQFLTSGGRESDANPGLTEFRMKHRDDFWLHVEALRTNLLHDENVKGIVLNTRDVSERKAFEEQLQHQAFHDAVTGLANRALFKDRVEHMIERQSRDDLPVSVLFMDLDDFKTINDSLGHAAGDRMLGEVGERLKNSLRQADTAARLGGDEFAILLEDGGDGVDAAEVAARILASLEGRSTSRARRSSSAPRSASRPPTRERADPRAPRSSCGTPTWRCTWPRKPGRAATRCSNPRCTTPPCSAWSSRPISSAPSTTASSSCTTSR